MKEIEPETYCAIADMLLGAIGDREFYNGTIEYGTQMFESKFRATLIIYRSQERRRIADIVPVWWEFHMNIAGEGEVVGDFCWRELKKYLTADDR